MWSNLGHQAWTFSFENETSTNSCACLHLQPCHFEWSNNVWCIIVARFEVRLFYKVQICRNKKPNPIPWNQKMLWILYKYVVA